MAVLAGWGTLKLPTGLTRSWVLWVMPEWMGGISETWNLGSGEEDTCIQ